MLNLFTKHPKSLGLTYWEHMKGSLGYSYSLFSGSIKASIHAVFPFFYETSTTDVVKKIQEDMKKIHNN